MLFRFEDTLDIGNSVPPAAGHDPHAFAFTGTPQHFERSVNFEFAEQPAIAIKRAISTFGIFLACCNGSLKPLAARLEHVPSKCEAVWR